MTKTISEHEGKKYLRTIYPAGGVEVDPKRVSIGLQIDVYCVLDAFNVTCQATGHAIKKLLCAGERGKGDRLADLIGAEAALSRAIELEKGRQRIPVKEEMTDTEKRTLDELERFLNCPKVKTTEPWEELVRGNIEACRRREVMESDSIPITEIPPMNWSPEEILDREG